MRLCYMIVNFLILLLNFTKCGFKLNIFYFGIAQKSELILRYLLFFFGIGLIIFLIVWDRADHIQRIKWPEVLVLLVLIVDLVLPAKSSQDIHELESRAKLAFAQLNSKIHDIDVKANLWLFEALLQLLHQRLLLCLLLLGLGRLVDILRVRSLLDHPCNQGLWLYQEWLFRKFNIVIFDFCRDLVDNIV